MIKAGLAIYGIKNDRFGMPLVGETNSIFERATMDTIRQMFPRFVIDSGNPNYNQLDVLIGQDLVEELYSGPRCTRFRQWNVDSRLSQVEEQTVNTLKGILGN